MHQSKFSAPVKQTIAKSSSEDINQVTVAEKKPVVDVKPVVKTSDLPPPKSELMPKKEESSVSQTEEKAPQMQAIEHKKNITANVEHLDNLGKKLNNNIKHVKQEEKQLGTKAPLTQEEELKTAEKLTDEIADNLSTANNIVADEDSKLNAKNSV